MLLLYQFSTVVCLWEGSEEKEKKDTISPHNNCTIEYNAVSTYPEHTIERGKSFIEKEPIQQKEIRCSIASLK